MSMWHGIETPRMPGMTAQQTARAQVNATQHAVALHGLEHVLRAGRIEATARPEQRTQGELVGAYQV